MYLEEASTSYLRPHPGSANGEGVQPKRRRITSASPAGAATDGSPSAFSGEFEDEESDGCQTPPRELDSRSASPALLDDDAAVKTKLPAERAATSTSPPPTPHRHASQGSSMGIGEEDEAQKNRSSSQRARSTSSTELSSLSSRASSPALPSASKLNAARLTRSKRSVSAKQGGSNNRLEARSAEAEEALARYVADDEALHTWAAEWGIKNEGVVDSLQRFIDAHQDWNLGNVFKRIYNWRSKYQEFKRKLTADSRSIPIADWSNSADLNVLARWRQSTHTISRWLEIWHDRINVVSCCSSSSDSDDDQASPPPASRVPRGKARKVAAPPRRSLRASSSSSSSSSSSGQAGESSNHAARLAQSSSSASSKAEEQLAEVKGQLAQQAQEIALLRQQSHQQSQLLAQQAQQSQLQIEMLQRMEQRLGSLQGPSGEQ